MALAAPASVGSAAGTVKLTDYGADSCTAPSETQMRAFWTNTPFSYWGIYMGGSDRGCAQPNLTRKWVSDMLAMGWDLLPIWVGPQNPCTAGQASYFSRNPTRAYAQGKAQALAAYFAWRTLSSVNNVPIDYDLEAPLVNSASCRAAAKAFVNGWVAQLHVPPAQVAGVYTSVCGGNIDDFAYISHRPDFIDAADWDYFPSTGKLVCVPANHWVNHQRHKQYRGGHNETYNRVTLNIDSRCADAAVYGVRSNLSATHPCARTAPAANPAVDQTLAAAGGSVSWHGAEWRAGGPLDAQLQRGSSGNWTSVSVDGTLVTGHDVNPAVSTVGTPVAMRDGSLVVPVTTHNGDKAAVVVYSTTDGRHFTQRARLPVHADLGAGVAVPTAARAGSRLVILDPAGSAAEWSKNGVVRFRAAGLPNGVEAVTFSGAGDGQAVVQLNSCGRKGVGCVSQQRVYRTSDGGRRWR